MACLAAAILSACEGRREIASTPVRPAARNVPQGIANGSVRRISLPFAGQSTSPSLLADGSSGFYLSWIDRQSGALNFSMFRGGRWFQPRTIARGRLLVNHADFPSMAAGGGALYAQWVERDGEASVVKVSRSANGGATWSAPATPHGDVRSKYGFVSMTASSDGTAEVIWLDGHKLKGGVEGAGDMGLRHSRMGTDGTFGVSTALDQRVCDCCQTAMASTTEGPVAVYRNRSPAEVRDIAITRFRAGKWTEPQIIHADGWKLPGCPVNGPQVAADGEHLVVVWYSGAERNNGVFASWSHDAGTTFENPVRIDEGHGAGHVAVALLPDRSALISWVEQRGSALVELRRLHRDGTLGAVHSIGEGESVSSVGYPRMAVSGHDVTIAWNGPAAVQLASIPIEDE